LAFSLRSNEKANGTPRAQRRKPISAIPTPVSKPRSGAVVTAPPFASRATSQWLFVGGCGVGFLREAFWAGRAALSPLCHGAALPGCERWGHVMQVPCQTALCTYMAFLQRRGADVRPRPDLLPSPADQRNRPGLREALSNRVLVAIRPRPSLVLRRPNWPPRDHGWISLTLEAHRPRSPPECKSVGNLPCVTHMRVDQDRGTSVAGDDEPLGSSQRDHARPPLHFALIPRKG